MSSGVGVTYELEFVIKDKKAREAINQMVKQAQKLIKTLDRVTLSKATGALKKFNNELKNSETAIQKLARYKQALGKQINNPFKQVKKGADGATRSIDSMIKRIQRGFLYKVGSFIFQQGQKAWQDFSNIDFDIRASSSKTGGFGKDYKDLFELATRVGAETRFTNADVSKALNAGSTLGIKKEELKAILPITAQLAQAFNTDIPFAMEITKMHMNTYSISQDKAMMVTDMLAATAKNSAADLERLAEGFKYVGGQAKALDIPLEQVYAVLGKMNDSGFTGSTAGTAFNNFLVNLANFKKRAKLEELIGSVTDQKGNLMELSNILGRIKDVTNKMGNADKASVIQTIFGIRGSKAVNTFLNQGIDGLQELQEKIKNSSGLTKMMSKYMMSGAAGAIEELLSTMESAFQSIFQSLSPLIVPVAIALRSIGQAIIFINQKLPFLGQFLSILGSFAVGKIVFHYLRAKLLVLIPAIQSAIAGFSLMKVVLFGGVIVALMVLFHLFEKWMKYVSENEEVSKSWEQTLRLLNYTFQNSLDLFLSLIKALFGLNEKQEETKDNTKDVKKTFDNLNRTLFEVNLKIQEMRRWVQENSKTIKAWGKAFLILSGVTVIIKSITTAIALMNAVMAANPYVLIALGVIAAIIWMAFWYKWLYENIAWFREGVNFIWSQIKQNLEIVIGFIVGGPFGALIGGLVKLYDENKNFKEFCDWAWPHIKKLGEEAFNLLTSSVDSLTKSLKEAISAFKELLNGNWSELNKRISGWQIVKNAESRMGPTQSKSTGTDYFQGWKSNGLTTIDEHGDELAWLPNGTMIVKNRTSQDMLNTMKSINKNTRLGTGGNVYKNDVKININVNNSKEGANEILRELEILGVV